MPKQILKNELIKVNGIDLSDHAHSIATAETAAQTDVTAFGGNGYQQFMQGLKDATITVEFFQDFDANSVASTLQPLFASGTAFWFETRADSTSPVSATNPRGSMLTSLYDYAGLNGQVGNASMTTATFRNAGSGITWGTV